MARRPGTRRGMLMSPARYFRIQRAVLRAPEARKHLSAFLRPGGSCDAPSHKILFLGLGSGTTVLPAITQHNLLWRRMLSKARGRHRRQRSRLLHIAAASLHATFTQHRYDSANEVATGRARRDRLGAWTCPDSQR